MNNATKVGLFALCFWKIGFLFIGYSDASDDIRSAWLLLPIWGPVGLIVLMQVCVWAIEGLDKILHR